ncbi:Gfo/Idh/MocA family oxidoreductase [Alphaproteobacteria bacterium]|nr:Gfo/Idh/MocA family oxidoreductase [Alphaproteobacteria bacterium]MDC1023106.1 Gfo/Idh/MocA family oxidoreductase [Alphaproteobacteria bacterium]
MNYQIWNSFCIVGMGLHAKEKLIPALLKSKKKIEGVVTSQNNIKLECPKFKTVNQALLKLSKNTVYIISTPPHLHFKQIKEIISFKKDVIVEKPAFINFNEGKQIFNLATLNDNIVFEAFMHRYTKLYKNFIEFWKENNHNIISIESNFIIPRIPDNTFRSKDNIKCSCLFDMGCYGLSLLVDIGFLLSDIKIVKKEYQNALISSLVLSGIENGVTIKINFGIGKEYKNDIIVTKRNKDNVKFWPFFYGRKDTKYILYKSDEGIKVNKINDINAFEKMFNNTRQNLMSNQNNRFEKMLIVTRKLDELAMSLNSKKFK